jgi:Domain of unknown function (DUF4129)
VTRLGRLAALAGLAAALAAAPATAGAAATVAAATEQDVVAVTGEELVALARQAERDAAARARLLRVVRVDGRPVAVAAALAGARGADLGRRARVLARAVAAAGDAPADTAAASRARAAAILDDRRYQGADLPRPFAGPLAWLGEKVEWLMDQIGTTGDGLPGGPFVSWLVVAAALVLLAGGLSTVTIRRRAAAVERARAAAVPRAEDPRALERDAERAERDGDWERAVRLRFRAGLLRLDRRRAIAYRPSITTGEVARAIGSPAFADVGRRFDAIAYGGRPAEEEDAQAARSGWRTILAETTAVREGAAL